MSLLDHSGHFPQNKVAIYAMLKLDRRLVNWLTEEARKRGISFEQYVEQILAQMWIEYLQSTT